MTLLCKPMCVVLGDKAPHSLPGWSFFFEGLLITLFAMAISDNMEAAKFIALSANDAAAFFGKHWPIVTLESDMPRGYRNAFWLVL